MKIKSTLRPQRMEKRKKSQLCWRTQPSILEMMGQNVNYARNTTDICLESEFNYFVTIIININLLCYAADSVYQKV